MTVTVKFQLPIDRVSQSTNGNFPVTVMNLALKSLAFDVALDVMLFGLHNIEHFVYPIETGIHDR